MSINFDHSNTPDLDERSLFLRRLVIRAFEGGSRGHLGSSMSLIEILRILYDEHIHFDISNPNSETRDRLILSKGHGCLAQYALLADKGFIQLSDLDKFCHPKGILGGHPERSKVPGVEASTGALGHGPSIGVGIALAAKIRSKSYKTIVITGDGEINEGSVWEAAMSASKHGLENLTWMIDYNKLQSYGLTKEVLDLEPLTDKLKSFGFNVQNIDGHNLDDIRRALAQTNRQNGYPHAIVCHTVKGKGFPFAEQNPYWHHKSKLSPEEISQMYQCVSGTSTNA
jgi:transketolase